MREAIIKAFCHGMTVSLLIIIPTIAPLYIITGVMQRQMINKVN